MVTLVALALLAEQLVLPGCREKSLPTSASPVASFTFSPASPLVNEAVQFTDNSTGAPTSWSWVFGDGGTSTLQNPTHAYSAPGNFNVTLIATNARGSNAATRVVTATGPGASGLSIVLGRPTDKSIAANVRADADVQVFLEYGTARGTYTSQTPSVALVAGTPTLVAIAGLAPDTQYYYRARYRATGETTYRADVERTFHTWRPAGSTFTFVVQADPHLDGNSSAAVYSQTLANELADRPDFLVDLGDASMVDKCAINGQVLCDSPNPPTLEAVRARNELVRSYFDLACHSVPLFMVLGNHDGEAGWNGTLDAWSVATRKAFFANPEPDAFYTGNTEAWPGIGLRQDYYVFEWGDALIVVLDPYTYTSPKPGLNGWGWTLGTTQYQWLARTLAGSRAKFKFVFSHHLLGGSGTDTRGGVAFAHLFEWGGRNLDGSWGFDRERPGWTVPIHQLLVDNKVTAWFHGHDHLYAQEQLDGVVYQEVPQPSLARYDTTDPGAGYGYVGTTGVNIFPSSGHLRVTVSSSEVRVEYVRSVAPADETASRKNGSVVTSYVMR